ncbi:kinase-like protein [Xylona heveae TC161]|uniref:non-specific serine/threonine protein kinase n=1 Tax=Xylona heveae (strain CBS 132557 / TC161) TaxID=1328760 RepID=A0A165K466_XYLHT|nr:kinase-like protein [Xylona heveae TC161]KZF26962.1 kinase-like protein [Xylona heveae TC161]
MSDISTTRRSRFLKAVEFIKRQGPLHPLFKFFNVSIGGEFFKCQGEDYPADYPLDKWKLDQNFTEDFCKAPCAIFDEKFINYGVIGSGTWGTVFAGRTREANDEGKALQVAVKIYHLEEDVHYDRRRQQYTSEEIVKLYLLSKVGGCERIPDYYDSMIHGAVAVLVMEPFGLDSKPEQETAEKITSLRGAPRFDSFTGVSLTREKKPLLSEVQVCKIMSQLLEALLYLNDRRIAHEDLSVRNFLVNEQLDAKLIDFGYADVKLYDVEYAGVLPPNNPWIEDMISPEIVIGIVKHQYNAESPSKRMRTRDTVYPPIATDHRTVLLWRFACIAYTLLHGYAPWDVEDPSLESFPVHSGWSRQEYSDHLPIIDARRTRIINEELPIHERLSPECAEVLNAMLHQDPEQRPMLEELATFPWFQGWYHDSGAEFVRPHDRAPSEGKTPPGAHTNSGSHGDVSTGKRSRSELEEEEEEDEEEERQSSSSKRPRVS